MAPPITCLPDDLPEDCTPDPVYYAGSENPSGGVSVADFTVSGGRTGIRALHLPEVELGGGGLAYEGWYKQPSGRRFQAPHTIKHLYDVWSDRWNNMYFLYQGNDGAIWSVRFYTYSDVWYETESRAGTFDSDIFANGFDAVNCNYGHEVNEYLNKIRPNTHPEIQHLNTRPK